MYNSRTVYEQPSMVENGTGRIPNYKQPCINITHSAYHPYVPIQMYIK